MLTTIVLVPVTDVAVTVATETEPEPETYAKQRSASEQRLCGLQNIPAQRLFPKVVVVASSACEQDSARQSRIPKRKFSLPHRQLTSV